MRVCEHWCSPGRKTWHGRTRAGGRPRAPCAAPRCGGLARQRGRMSEEPRIPAHSPRGECRVPTQLGMDAARAARPGVLGGGGGGGAGVRAPAEGARRAGASMRSAPLMPRQPARATPPGGHAGFRQRGEDLQKVPLLGRRPRAGCPRAPHPRRHQSLAPYLGRRASATWLASCGWGVSRAQGSLGEEASLLARRPPPPFWEEKTFSARQCQRSK